MALPFADDYGSGPVQPFFKALAPPPPGNKFLSAVRGGPVKVPSPVGPVVPPMQVSPTAIATTPGADMVAQMQKRYAEQQAVVDRANADLASFQPNLGPTPEYVAPKMQEMDKGVALGNAIGAAFMPRYGQIYGAQVQADEQRRATDYQNATQEAQARYNAENQVATRAERLAEFQERQKQAYAKHEEDVLQRTQKDLVTASKDVLVHQAAEHRTDEYAKAAFDRSNISQQSVLERIRHDREMYGLGMGNLDERRKRDLLGLEEKRMQVAASLQGREISASTALTIANQRQSIALVLEQMREHAGSLKETMRERFQGAQNAARGLLSAYDRAMTAQSMAPSDENALRLKQLQPQYDAIMSQLSAASAGAIQSHPLSQVQDMNALKAETEAKARALSTEGMDPAALVNYLTQDRLNLGTGGGANSPGDPVMAYQAALAQGQLQGFQSALARMPLGGYGPNYGYPQTNNGGGAADVYRQFPGSGYTGGGYAPGGQPPHNNQQPSQSNQLPQHETALWHKMDHQARMAEIQKAADAIEHHGKLPEAVAARFQQEYGIPLREAYFHAHGQAAPHPAASPAPTGPTPGLSIGGAAMGAPGSLSLTAGALPSPHPSGSPTPAPAPSPSASPSAPPVHLPSTPPMPSTGAAAMNAAPPHHGGLSMNVGAVPTAPPQPTPQPPSAEDLRQRHSAQVIAGDLAAPFHAAVGGIGGFMAADREKARVEAAEKYAQKTLWYEAPDKRQGAAAVMRNLVNVYKFTPQQAQALVAKTLGGSDVAARPRQASLTW